MVVIRLSRGGANKRPFYKIVVADRRDRRDGRNIEQLGYFNPIATDKETKCSLQFDRLDYWVSVGAQMSPRVEAIVKAHRKASSACSLSPESVAVVEEAA